MPNPYVNKVVQSNGTTLIDISDTTAVAADVASGKYFYLATGEKVPGTASGGDEPSGPTYETYFDDSITIDTYISIPSLSNLYFAEGETWRVTWDGVEYLCDTAIYQNWLWTIGNQSLASTDDGVNEPFLLYNYGGGAMNGNARTGGTHTLKLEKQTSSGGGASYDGIEVVYDSNNKVTDYVCHMENIPQFALNYVQYSRQPSDGVAEISFSTKPTHIGKCAFDHAKCQIDFSNLDELMYIGEAAFQSFRSDGYDGSSYVVNLPKFVGYYNAAYSATSVFRATSNNNAYTPKIYNLPVCTIIPQYAWYQCSGSGWDVTIGSVGHAVTESKKQPFGGNTGITGTCTIYTTGDKVDTLNTTVQNGAGAGLVFVFKASEATTYGGTSYAAGDTIVTSTP